MKRIPENQTERFGRLWHRILVRGRQELYRRTRQKEEKQIRVQRDVELKASLGEFAQEIQMPTWLREYLKSRDYKSRDGIVHLLGDILKDTSQTHSAYLCHPSVCRITKLRREGSFCGYRNIQMLLSYIIASTEMGYRSFPNGIPHIFELQDQIEEAWDNGYNSTGRAETGGIKGTRKYIGTPEVQALLLNLNIGCSARRFQNLKERSAADQLADDVMKYFRDACADTNNDRLYSTLRPPIYLQRPGHSMTIIGIEKTAKNALHLLVFNPGRRYRDNTHLSRSRSTRQRQAILDAYRLQLDSLRKYSELEVL